MFSYDVEEMHGIDRSMDRKIANNENYGGYATFYPTEGLGIYTDPLTVRYNGSIYACYRQLYGGQHKEQQVRCVCCPFAGVYAR